MIAAQIKTNMKKLFINKTYILTLTFSIIIGFMVSMFECISALNENIDKTSEMFNLSCCFFMFFYVFVISLGSKQIIEKNKGQCILYRLSTYFLYSLPVFIIFAPVKIVMFSFYDLRYDFFMSNIISDFFTILFVLSKCIFQEYKITSLESDTIVKYRNAFNGGFYSLLIIAIFFWTDMKNIGIMYIPVFLLIGLLAYCFILYRYFEYKKNHLSEWRI